MRKYLIYALFTCLLMLSCRNKPKETGSSEEGLIEITKAQFQSEQMLLGEPSLLSFSELVHFTGTICPSADGIVRISLPINGMIEKIYCNQGQFVEKGRILFEIGGNDFIDMQKDFAESAASLQRLKSEYERIQELNKDNISSQKELILAESAYKSETAKYNALKIKLEKTGLDITKMEAGNFFASYPLKAPVKGYITQINIAAGQYPDQQFIIAEIVDADQLRLCLFVFEKDASRIQTGQTVEFYLPEEKDKIFHARLSFTGKSINTDSKAIDCYASLSGPDNNTFINNQYVEGNIIVNSDSVYALPEASLLKSENDYYLLDLEKETDSVYYFKRVKINAGRKNNDYIELIEKPAVNKVIVRGTYNIQME